MPPQHNTKSPPTGQPVVVPQHLQIGQRAVHRGVLIRTPSIHPLRLAGQAKRPRLGAHVPLTGSAKH